MTLNFKYNLSVCNTDKFKTVIGHWEVYTQRNLPRKYIGSKSQKSVRSALKVIILSCIFVLFG